MAFATSNVKTVNLGGGLRITTGTWSGSEGDAAGTLVVPGSSVVMGQFYNNVAGATLSAPFSWATGSTQNTVTVTVENIATVASGRFGLVTR